ncbi:TrmH family RNA methyltransferase [Noviherbaspirillum galbum]|uniref:RNA methyltransferase n=1 Tax=Noviherbaspirillum galbum TaxID=2709383 RepID=A0A6B3SFT2_9BURK|nr:RNA methyltransferase [Noviherbaspirillum galbum]NEX59757.1 RNA methyltransferase [Noviherbaspirillum galbum]
MKPITSRDNPLYKEIKLLATSSQARRKARRTLLDGIHLCDVYLRQVGHPVLAIVNDAASAHPEVAALVAECERRRVQAISLPDSLYKAISQVENGIGILFVVDTPEPSDPGALAESAVLLDNLQDPGNMGSILRSAAAAGVRHVLCGPGTVFAWSPKVLRAGMGAHFLLNIVEGIDLETVVSAARVPVLATSSHAAKTVYDVDLSRPVAWMFGHEGQGVSENLLRKASVTVGIPHIGKIESLNVAASVAVCLFEQVRQTMASPDGKT